MTNFQVPKVPSVHVVGNEVALQVYLDKIIMPAVMCQVRSSTHYKVIKVLANCIDEC